MTTAPSSPDLTTAALGIELGSTRIKAVLVDAAGTVLATGGHDWENELVDGVWTYSVDAVVTGLQDAYATLAAAYRERYGVTIETLGALGVSGMVHGYLPLDATGELLTGFRTWRNTITADSAATLSELFGLNIPQRWSIAHLHHAVLSAEEHVDRIDRITTLAGYVTWRLTGTHVLGVGEASGVFPIGADGRSFDKGMIGSFDDALADRDLPWRLAEVLPDIAVAGEQVGALTADGAALLDPSGALQPGAVVVPPEGDAGTGMVATNAVRPRTGNVSAGTSAFAMVVLERPLRSLIAEIDLVSTPAGAPVAMAHANNCTSDLNAWVEVFAQFATATGHPIERGALFDILLGEAATADMDTAGVMSYNFLSGDALVGLEEGRPLTMRLPSARMSLSGLMRSHLFALFAAMAHGLRVLREASGVSIESMRAHGGIFATPEIPQRVLAAAFDTPVSVGTSASEGGAWGMALLAAYALHSGGAALEDWLDGTVFAHDESVTLTATPEEVAEYDRYLKRFMAGLPVESSAVEVF